MQAFLIHVEIAAVGATFGLVFLLSLDTIRRD